MFGQSKNYEKLAGKPYKMEQVIPVLTADELLSGNAHQAYIQEIFDLVAVGDQHFNTLYLDLINRFAEFVQLIPKKPTYPLGSFLNMGLRRAWRGLMLLKDRQSLSDNPAQTYLLYSALLLRDLSDLGANQKINLCDETGIYIADWIPASGSMLNRGPFYRLFFRQSIEARMTKEITVMLARQIMPTEGFTWLAADAQLIVDWLLTLLDEQLVGGVLADLLTIVRLEETKREATEQHHLVEQEYWLDPLDPNAKTLPAVAVNLRTATGTAVGEAFLVWLQEGLAAGRFATNAANAGLHGVDGGVFIEYPEIFRQFAEGFEKPLHVVFTQFGNLFGGVGKQGAGDYQFDQFFSDYPSLAEGRKASQFGFGPLASKAENTRKGIVVDGDLLLAKGGLEMSSHLQAASQRAERKQALPTLKQTAGPKPSS